MTRIPNSRIYRLLYPAVPVVVSAAHGGRISAMPVVSLISLSNEPPMVGFSSSPSHATHKAVLRARRFSVSWLDGRYGKAVGVLGSTSGAGVPDKLSAAGLHYRLQGSPEVPILREASAHLVCGLVKVKKFGDHELLVGRVEDARAIRDFGEYWEFKKYRPILYTGLGQPALPHIGYSDDLD